MRRAAILVARILLRVIFAAGVVVAIVYALGATYIGTPQSLKSRLEDTNTLRGLAKLVTDTGKIPLKDGAFDPCAFVRSGDIVREQYKFFFYSARSDTGPTEAEIEHCDYTNFPWERYRGDGRLEGPPVALLWSSKPDRDGRRWTGFSDGSCRLR